MILMNYDLSIIINGGVTVPFVPGATLALALVNIVLEKINQVVELEEAASELRNECQVLSKSVTVV